MSQTPGSFRPSELDRADDRPGDADLASAWATARELEAALPPEVVTPTTGFADRVMAAVAREPAPRAAGFLAPLRRRPGIAGLVASIRDAWSVVGGGPGRPVRARGLALAYVIAVLVIGASLTGVAAIGTAGALGLLDGDRTPTPSIVPTIEPTPPVSTEPRVTGTPEPAGSPEPTESTEPTESSEPTESTGAEPSDDHETPRPSATSSGSQEPSEDASPSPQDDHGSSPEPSKTPRPSDTPRPSQTPD